MIEYTLRLKKRTNLKRYSSKL